MASEITFDRLVDIYKTTVFDASGDEGTIAVTTAAILDDLKLIGEGAETAALSGITIACDLEDVAVGDTVRATIRGPGLSLGILARTFDGLLNGPKARLRSPKRFFVVEGGVTPEMEEPPPVLQNYRRVLRLTALLEQAAAYLHPEHVELMFIGKRRIPVPIRYDAAMLISLPVSEIEGLLNQFGDETLKAQKLTLLNNGVVDLVAARPPETRFGAILANIGEILRELKDGYQLLTSEFSFAKIRRDVETAQFDYLNKIHKTFNDIQGQLLGIPVATFVVASQLKPASKCDADFWTDAGVVGGAWIFVTFFLIAIANQWLTLDAVKAEIEHQKSAIAEQGVLAKRFAPVFRTLTGRIRLHRIGMFVVGAIAVAGATAATVAFYSLVSLDPGTCLSSAVSTAEAGGHRKRP